MRKRRGRRAKSAPDLTITATVAAIIRAVPEGRRPFVVTYPSPMSVSKDLPASDSITFSLPNWQGGSDPEIGQLVVLSELRQFVGGWRARSARPITPRKTETEGRIQ